MTEAKLPAGLNAPPASKQQPPPQSLDLLLAAIQFASHAHACQVDKAGVPYIWHVLRVGISLLPDVDAAITGVLHDVLEDCPSAAESLHEFCLPMPDVYAALELLTHRGDWNDYIQQIASAVGEPGRLARKVKLSDLADNVDPSRTNALFRCAANEAETQAIRDRVQRYYAARTMLRDDLRKRGEH